MAVSVASVAPDEVVLRAPLAPNINHRETVFGGSASALAILAAWSLLHARLRSEGVASRLVIQRNTMEYEHPIVGDFTARASLERSEHWQQFTRITWPLIWPVTALVFTIQLILQLKIFDQVYLFASGGRDDPTMVLVQYIYKTAFQQNKGGMGAAIASILFALIVVCSVLQFQFLRGRSGGR